MTAITIDPRKVNVIEQDIEEWLWENPTEVPCHGGNVKKWLARQYHVPSGIIDLLGMTEDGELCVVEVKNTEINADAMTQVSRYAMDLTIAAIPWKDTYEVPVHKTVVFKGGVNSEIQFEADALDICLVSFYVELELTIKGPWTWTKDHYEKLKSAYLEISNNEIFAEVRAMNQFPSENETQEDSIVEEARQVIEEEQDKDEQE